MLGARHLHRERQGHQGRARPVYILDGADAVFRVRNDHLLLAPGLSELGLGVLLGILDCEPAGALDLLLQDEELKHALLGAEYALKCVASEVGRKGRHSRGVLDLQDLVLAMLQRRLEAVLAVNSLALQHRDVLESSLPDLFELSVDIGEQLVLLVLRESAAGLPLDLGDGIHRPLHTVDLERARDVLVQLGLPNLAKEVEVGAELLLVGVDPEER